MVARTAIGAINIGQAPTQTAMSRLTVTRPRYRWQSKTLSGTRRIVAALDVQSRRKADSAEGNKSFWRGLYWLVIGVRLMASKSGRIFAAAIGIAALLNPGTLLAGPRGGGSGHGGGGHFGGGAHFGGGGHFGGGTTHFSAGHFGGGAAHFHSFGGVRGFSGSHFGAARIGHAHFGSANVRAFSGSHLGALRIGHGHFRSANFRNFNGARLGAYTGVAHINSAHALASGATGALAGRAAWSRWGNPNWHAGWNGGWGGWNGSWGGWNAGWGGWVGPVFWPYFFGNLLAFTFWPYPYFDPFWA